jgi:hypothetical protein
MPDDNAPGRPGCHIHLSGLTHQWNGTKSEPPAICYLCRRGAADESLIFLAWDESGDATPFDGDITVHSISITHDGAAFHYKLCNECLLLLQPGKPTMLGEVRHPGDSSDQRRKDA